MSNVFQSLVDAFSGSGSAFNDGVKYSLGTATQVSSPVGAGARAAGLAGKYGMDIAKFGSAPGVAAIAGGLPGLMEGDLLQAGGGAAGGASGGLLARAVTPALAVIPGVGPALAIGANIALPMIGSAIGSSIGDSLNQPAQAATNAVGNQLNPSSMRNVAGGAAEDIEAQASRLRAALGDDAARAYLQQALQAEKYDQIDENRSKRAIRMMPVRSAARLAELGTQGNIAMNLRAMDGTNQMLSNVTASNPYAQMLVA
jgi:hypothetical protein